MRFSQSTSTSLTLASLCTISQAWPLFLYGKREPIPAPQSYSVVPVDGGSNAAPATRTVTNILTQSQVQTIVSIATAGGSAQPTTIVTTEVITTTIIQTVPITVTAETTVAGQVTTLIVEPSVTSVPYDNGQWHTTYYYRSTLSDVLVPISSTATPSNFTAPSATSTATSVEAALETPSETSPTSTSTITVAAELAAVTSTSTSTASASTTTDWSKEYGTWREKPENGSWWGKDKRMDSAYAKNRLARLS